MFKNLRTFALVSAVLGFALPRTVGAADDASVLATEAATNLFGGREARLPLTITANRPLQGIAAWSLEVDQRTIARGEMAVAAGPHMPGNLELRVEMPKVRAGTVLRAVLSITIYTVDRRAAGTSLVKQLWLFPENPFADRLHSLPGLKICLFDPPGNTRELFDKMKIPCSRTANVDSLDSLNGALLIIGEGTSLKEYRGLPEMMVKAAAGGATVLCLAPSDGKIVLPGSFEAGTELPMPKRLALRRNDVICELDKRLDELTWGHGARPLASSLLVRSDRNRVVGEVVPSPDGWPWLEAGFPAKHGLLIICGFGIVRHWDAGPTPRFLFARILDNLTQIPSRPLSTGE
jgi:hypothetical protein